MGLSWNQLLFVTCTFHLINAETLDCYFGSICKTKVVSLNNVDDLIGTRYFDVTRPTVVYTFGAFGKADGTETIKILDALLSNNDTNVCLLNWEEEAREGKFIPNYATVIGNSAEIGKKFGRALIKLSTCGLDLKNVWLIGFSVGAHLMGEAGRVVINSGCAVDRITGCDPAYPGYDEPLRLEKALNSQCASFVDIIHTTDVKYGMVTPTGDVDFYPNRGYYKKHGVQPGCPMGIFIPLSENDLCSHQRSIEYLAQAILTPNELKASKANSYKEWQSHHGAQDECTYLGKHTNREYCGKFYLSTNRSPPFGKGKKGLKP